MCVHLPHIKVRQRWCLEIDLDILKDFAGAGRVTIGLFRKRAGALLGGETLWKFTYADVC